MQTDAAPLIVTLALDEAAFQKADAWRTQYFPRERLFVPAHVTLFHKLPGQKLAAVEATLGTFAHVTPVMPVFFAAPEFYGRGFGVKLDAPPLVTLRKELAAAFDADLSQQDQKGFRPHVTVTNKLYGAAARANYHQFLAAFKPFSGDGCGLMLWRYLNGPWEKLRYLPFAGRAQLPPS